MASFEQLNKDKCSEDVRRVGRRARLCAEEMWKRDVVVLTKPANWIYSRYHPLEHGLPSLTRTVITIHAGRKHQ